MKAREIDLRASPYDLHAYRPNKAYVDEKQLNMEPKALFNREPIQIETVAVIAIFSAVYWIGFINIAIGTQGISEASDGNAYSSSPDKTATHSSLRRSTKN